MCSISAAHFLNTPKQCVKTMSLLQTLSVDQKNMTFHKKCIKTSCLCMSSSPSGKLTPWDFRLISRRIYIIATGRCWQISIHPLKILSPKARIFTDHLRWQNCRVTCLHKKYIASRSSEYSPSVLSGNTIIHKAEMFETKVGNQLLREYSVP